MGETKKNKGCARCKKFRSGLSTQWGGYACETGNGLDSWLNGPGAIREIVNPAEQNKNLDCPMFEEK